MQKNKGFTLIELIVVIVILAVLAAVALPRFTNLQRDARIAKLNAARGSVAASSALIHATLLARNGISDKNVCPADGGGPANNLSTSTGTICTEAGIVNVVNSYPATTAIGGPAGILTSAGLTTVFNPTLSQLQAEGYSYSASGASATFQVLGGSDINTCAFTYTQPASNAAPIISAVATDGC